VESTGCGQLTPPTVEDEPQRFLRRFINGVGAIIDHLDAYSVNLGPMAFSGTITTRGRFLFWDFFPADSSKAMLL